ncbi:MAG: helix-turn-helix transcriptional regulator [Actinomycetota bacterium]|nr:helix-turn-helix transcriptional regulator [Actinomycetota bacterium]
MNISAIDEVALRRMLPAPDRCRAIRLRAGVSLARVGEDVGVTGQAILWWETGRSEPRAEHLAAYVAVLAGLEGATTP